MHIVTNQNRIKLYDLIDNHNPEAVYSEIITILSLADAMDVNNDFRRVYDDIIRLFYGTYPGYQASNTKYHNLEHTTMVALACARLIHGCIVGGYEFSQQNILLGLLAALYHDSGLIQTEQDLKGTGAKYTIGHEARSINFMREHFSHMGFSEEAVQDCAELIKCTNLAQKIQGLFFRSKELEIIGQIVGSSDLLAQMADRLYLERLVLLFKEFEEAGIPDFDSEEELLRKTEGFYKNVARKRLIEEMDNVSAYMVHHFKVRWGVNQDLYQVSINNNIKFLNKILDGCNNNDTAAPSYRRYLKRGGILGRNNKSSQ